MYTHIYIYIYIYIYINIYIHRPPYIFCGACECSICSGEAAGPILGGEEPLYLRCRGQATPRCSDCGWAAKYPKCPTLLGWDKVFT